MTLTIEANYRNGVFVPAERPALTEDARVRLVIEPIASGPLHVTNDGRADPFQNHRRIEIDPELAREIATSPEFLPEES
jgi:predicted DNA-binding antitoxin AbrB/MazE fold protein